MEINVSIFVGGALRGSKIVRTPCIIGRSKDASLTVAHPAMSRKHCELFEESGKLYLRDNSSLNGTLFKGDYVEDPVAVAFGEEFVVGELTFKISEPSGPLTEEQKELANRPTAAFTLENEAGEEVAPGMATILEPPGGAEEPQVRETMRETVREEPPQKPQDGSPPQKGGKKISPKDVQIKL